MYRVLIFLFISIFFASCTTKNSAFRYFDKDGLETKGVQATKKIDIVKDREVSVIFMATYLNRVDDSLINDKNEEFLVFLYFSASDSQNVEDNGYLFFLNENEPIYLEKIEKDNEKYGSLMLKNYWGSYYLVKFDEQIPPDDKQNLLLKLTLQDQNSNKVNLDFVKE